VSVVLQVAPQELEKAERRNVARQNGAECLFWACWYLEDEVRHVLGQGWASQGWPFRGLVMADKAPRAGEAASVRFRLLRASEVLGKAHERWQQEFAEKIEEREAADKRAFEQAQAAEERRISTEELRAIAGEEASAVRLQNDSGANLEAPEGFPQVLAKACSQRQVDQIIEATLSAFSAMAQPKASAKAHEPKAAHGTAHWVV